jgi:hypothetical protein
MTIQSTGGESRRTALRRASAFPTGTPAANQYSSMNALVRTVVVRLAPKTAAAFALIGVLSAPLLDRPRAPEISSGRRLFQFEQEAERYCADESVVWVIASRGIYNTNAERWYGQTNNGAFSCLRDAKRAGYRANGSRG